MRTPVRHVSIRKRILALLLAILTGGSALAQPAASADLPVTRLVLFTSGVGYFEHSGIVTGDAELQLSVPEEAMNDLLQSLVLQDLGGGTIRPVRYPSRDPLGRILSSYALDLSADPTLAELLSQARGQRVLIESSDSLSGRIVNVERVAVPEEQPVTYLTLATLTGLRRVDLAEVRTITFADRELQSELEAALAAIARQSREDAQTLTLRFEGEGERRVSVGYVREMPVWKTSYRLLLGGDGEADLQGWAIFDNPTAMDFDDVSISFVAGQPISFVSALFEPIYIERQRITPDRSPGVTAREFEADSFARAADMANEARAEMRLAAPAAVPQLSGAGVEAMAQASRSGASFEYRVATPVTVGRFESAMIPIISTTVEAQQLSIYDQSSHSLHPLRGVRLVNDTGLHLASGPVSVFDAGGFAGNALLGDVVPGDSRILAYAVDLDVTVNPVSESEPEELFAARIVNGLVETSHRQRITTSYEIDMRADAERFLIVEQPRRQGFEVVSPATPPVTTPQSYRFGVAIGGEGQTASEATVPTHVSCPMNGDCELTVVLERELSRSLAITNLSSDQIVFYLENLGLSEADREAFSAILDLKQQLSDVDSRIANVQQQIDDIFRDQSRIRQNMAQLDRNSSLYRRYLADLESQENELNSLGGTVESLIDERQRVQEQLDELILAL